MALWRFSKILGFIFFCWSHQAHAGFIVNWANRLGLVSPHKSVCLALLRAGEKLDKDKLEKIQVPGGGGASVSVAISSRAYTLNSFRALKSRLRGDPESVLNRGYARISSRGEVLRGSMDRKAAASRLSAIMDLSDRGETMIILTFSSQNGEKLDYAIEVIAREMSLTPLSEIGWRSISIQIQDFLAELASGSREYLIISESAEFSRDAIVDSSSGAMALSGSSQSSSVWAHADVLIERDPRGEACIHLLIQDFERDPQFPAKGRREIIGSPEMDTMTPVPNRIPVGRGESSTD
ncbi:MAG: hypothetical protein IPK68_00720 [Bdellovibrionales bacterium]|nr:hypothetical protein [Bdellovibrionales bacterium]